VEPTQSDRAALWLAGRVLAQADDDDVDRLVVDRIYREMNQKEIALSDQLRSLESGTAKPGEFGMELAGSAVIALLLPVLQSFFQRYVQKLTDAAADHAARLTLDMIQESLHRDLTQQPTLTMEELERALAEHGATAAIGKASADRFLAVLRDRDRLAAAASAG
jgi:hypothetical protein